MRFTSVLTLAATSMLTLTAISVPTRAAAAIMDCAPVIDTTSIAFAPTTVAVSSTGYQTQQFSAAFTAPCGNDNGSDLTADVIFTPTDEDGSSVLRASDGIYPSTAAQSYGVSALHQVLSGDLQNSYAGTWTTELSVTDTDDSPVSSYDDEAGPSIRVLRAARVTANATPEPVRKGKKITVTGTITRANWNTRKDGAYADRAVKLQFRTAGGTYATVKTVFSSTKGKVKATATATKDGYYRFAFVGNATTARAVSPGDHVNVT